MIDIINTIKLYPSVIISLFSLIVALIALWKSTLSPFKLNARFMEPLIFIPENSYENSYFLAGIRICNYDSQIGEVKNVKLVVNATFGQGEKTLHDNFEFMAKHIVDYGEIIKNYADFRKAVKGNWIPYTLKKNEKETLYLIFFINFEKTMEWNELIENAKINGLHGILWISTNIFSSKENNWINYDSFGMGINPIEDKNVTYTSNRITKGKDLHNLLKGKGDKVSGI
ncbi:MAG TPA: hypothetical protein HA367_04210 [Candidatus Methanofastidiosum sp.]|nr:hypothetical protein [Methanofastidiosum sp.]